MGKRQSGSAGLGGGWLTLLVGALVLAAVPATAPVGAVVGLALAVPGLYFLRRGRKAAGGRRKKSAAVLVSAALIVGVGVVQTPADFTDSPDSNQMAGEVAPSAPSSPSAKTTQEASPTPTAEPTTKPSKKPKKKPKPSPSETSKPTGSAASALSGLKIKGRAPKTGYSRDEYGPAWSDVDHNGCDTRNDILERDLSKKTYRPGTHDCIVLTGILNDPYTATQISFERGQQTSMAVQIDHVVALSDSWQKGAQQLSPDQRKALANDPYNLLAVHGPANQQKSDGDAATWLPANKGYRCEYVARQIGVKKKYSLWVTQGEHDAMANVLSSCPGQKLPEGGGADVKPTGKAPAQAPAPAKNEAPASGSGAGSGQGSGKSSGKDVYYENCTAVREAGAAPIYKGDPGYASKLDRDGDGVACE